MFGSQGYAAASRRYAAVDAGSRVAGATPHQLIRILFDELLLALDATAMAMSVGDGGKARDQQTRAMTILHALETSLDFDKGGEIARNLAVIYREGRRRMLAAVPEKDSARVAGVRAMIAEIAGAWGKIG